MKKFNYQDELNRIISDKQLAEINLQGAPTYKVAYILASDEDFTSYIEVSSSGVLSAVTICRTDAIESLRIDTIYLSELQKQVDKTAIFNRGLENIKDIKEYSFTGFFEAFENTKTIVEVTYENEDTLAGRIVACDEEVLALDEYYAENDRRFSRTYINRSIIARVSVDVAWIRTISSSLLDKNL